MQFTCNLLLKINANTQRQITAMEKKSKKAEQDLTSSMTNSQQLTRTNQEMTVSFNESAHKMIVGSLHSVHA